MVWPTRQILRGYDILNSRALLTKYERLKGTAHYDAQAIQDYQQERLGSILNCAARQTSFYRETIDTNMLDSPFEAIAKLPIMTKDTIRANFDSLVSDEYRDLHNACVDHTGGSTGEPLKFVYQKQYRDLRWALIHYNLTWAGYELGDCHGYVYGSSFDVKKQYSFRQRLQGWMTNSFQVNAFFLSERELEKFCARCLERKPKFLIGYASALLALARYVKSRGTVLAFDFIESTSEYLSPDTRKELEEVFQCGIYDRYGCREVGNVAHECSEHDGLHINWQSVYVEIVNQGKYDWLGPDYGDIIITSLHNKAMPLIRYYVGDIGRVAKVACRCGLQSDLMYVGGARTGDILYSIDGSMVAPPALTLIYKDLSAVDRIQFIQEKKDRLRLAIVKNCDREEELAELVRRIKKIFGSGMNIDIVFVERIEKEKSGKYRFTKRLF